MGLPVLEALYGKSILFAASMYNTPFQLLSFSIGAAMVSVGKAGGRADGQAEGARLSWRSFVTSAGIA
jgi:predicted permease